MNDNFQYISDSQLIEKFFLIDSAFQKKAGLLSDSLSGIASAFTNTVKSEIDTSSTSSLIISVLKLLVPATFFRLHPVLGILYSIASEMGFDITSPLKSISNTVESKLKNGELVSPNDLGSIINEASFNDLRQIEKDGFIRFAIWPFSKGPQKSLLHRVFGFLGRERGKSLAVAFVIWFVKTLLLSVGLLSVGGFVNKKLTKEEPVSQTQKKDEIIQGNDDDEEETSIFSKIRSKIPFFSSTPSHNLKPSGKGQEFHKNDDEAIWMVPMIGSVENTLKEWTKEIYPELKDYINIVSSLPSFNKTVNILKNELDSNYSGYILMPIGFNRRIDVVDTFAGDAAAKLPKETNEK